MTAMFNFSKDKPVGLAAAKIAGGIVSLVLGIIIFTVSMYFYNIQNRNLEYCNSISGGVQQYFDSETAQMCSNAGGFQVAIIGGMLLGAVLVIIGLVFVFVGAGQQGKRKRKEIIHNDNPSPRRQYNTRTEAKEPFCRYCGMKRSLEGEFCSRCGRSLLSTTTTSKKCQNCRATMSNDSIFCANCGKEFETQ
jgi:ascorbate-specific PTS system EIIC-type component UlaA